MDRKTRIEKLLKAAARGEARYYKIASDPNSTKENITDAARGVIVLQRSLIKLLTGEE